MSRTDVHRPYRVQENDPYDRANWIVRDGCTSAHVQRFDYDRETRTWGRIERYDCDLHLGRDERGPRTGRRCTRNPLRRTCGSKWCGGHYFNREARRRDRHEAKRALHSWIAD